jgi:hypothetical protein
MYYLHTLMSISRFFLRDKVTLRLLKLHLFDGSDVVEWSRALDIRAAVYQWCDFKSRRRNNKYLTAQNI